jgi:hypothetical protein
LKRKFFVAAILISVIIISITLVAFSQMNRPPPEADTSWIFKVYYPLTEQVDISTTAPWSLPEPPAPSETETPLQTIAVIAAVVIVAAADMKEFDIESLRFG